MKIRRTFPALYHSDFCLQFFLPAIIVQIPVTGFLGMTIVDLYYVIFDNRTAGLCSYHSRENESKYNCRHNRESNFPLHNFSFNGSFTFLHLCFKFCYLLTGDIYCLLLMIFDICHFHSSDL